MNQPRVAKIEIGERMQENFSTANGGPEVGDLPSRQVVVANQMGLHARPAGVLAKEAQRFESDILIIMKDQEVDAKSILDILTLAAGPGSALELRASGEDAEDALAAIEKLFKSRFGEER